MRQYKGVTLLELLIAIGLLGIMVVGLSSVENFSRYQMTTSDRRVQLQQEAAFVMEHMARQVSLANGNRVITGNNPVNNVTIGGGNATQVYIDSNRDGTGDRWVAYAHNSTDYRVSYCSNCATSACATCSSSWQNIASRISTFIPQDNATSNYLNVNLTSCWDSDGSPAACGDADNPAVTLSSRIDMPSVSTN